MDPQGACNINLLKFFFIKIRHVGPRNQYLYAYTKESTVTILKKHKYNTNTNTFVTKLNKNLTIFRYINALFNMVLFLCNGF